MKILLKTLVIILLFAVSAAAQGQERAPYVLPDGTARGGMKVPDWFQLSTINTTAPASADCDAASETGRTYWDSTNDRSYKCSGASGWVAVGGTGVWEVPLTFSTGLTRNMNTITVSNPLNAFVSFTGPTQARAYALPDAAATLVSTLTLNLPHAVTFVGDSLTDEGTYPARVGTLLGASWTVDEKGTGGDTTTQMLARFQADVIANIASSHVVILGGINDVRTDISAVTIEANLQAMYTSAHTSGLKVVAVTLMPFKGDSQWSAGRQVVLEAVNAWILTTATNVDYKIDAYAVLEDPGMADTLLAAYDSGDHLHLSASGYTFLGTTVHNGATWAAANGLLAVRGLLGKIDQDVSTNGTPSFVGAVLPSGSVTGAGTWAAGNVAVSRANGLISSVDTDNANADQFLFSVASSTAQGHLGVFANNIYFTSNWKYRAGGVTSQDDAAKPSWVVLFGGSDYFKVQRSAAGATALVDQFVLASGGTATFGTIATQDVIRILPNTSATRFTGSITPTDLSADRQWALPDAGGTLAISTAITGTGTCAVTGILNGIITAATCAEPSPEPTTAQLLSMINEMRLQLRDLQAHFGTK